MIRRIAGRIRRMSEGPRNYVRRKVYDVRLASSAVGFVSSALLRQGRRAFIRKNRLRIGVDIRPFYEPLTGIGWYLYHLLHELQHDPTIELVGFGDPMTTADGPRLHVELPPAMRVISVDWSERTLSRWSRPLSRAAYPFLAAAERCDLIFGANYFLPRNIDGIARHRVVTVHDLTYRRFPELLQQETLENLNRRMPEELKVADGVICVSEATRRDLLSFYDVDPDRVFTVLSGLAAPSETREAIPNLPKRYILFVSTIEPRKNVSTLISAFEQLCDRGGYDGSLVLVGKIGWKSEAVVEQIEKSRHRERIVHLDYLRKEQLATAYHSAEAFVFPSIYEGFGFPLLEAMAAGVPSIAARSSSLPEVGGDAALYFDPTDVETLTALLQQLLSSPEMQNDLRERGRLQAAKFSWAEAARQTTAVFHRVKERR